MKRCAPQEESAIQVEFVDGSQLSVEQSSEMVLSDYVYRRNGRRRSDQPE